MTIKTRLRMRSPSERSICLLFLIAFLADSAFHLTRYVLGGRNVGRAFLLGIMLLFSFSSIALRQRVRIYKEYYAVLLFVFLLFVGYLKPVSAGGDMKYANIYITSGFIYLSLLPIMYYCINSLFRLETLLRCVAFIGLITSTISILMEISYFTMPSIYQILSDTVNDLQMVSVNVPLGSVVRIMLSGIVFQVLGVFIGIYFFMKKKTLLFIMVVGINIIGILLTFARGLIAGTLLGLLIWVLLSVSYRGIDKKRARFIKGLAIVGLIAVPVFVISSGNGNVINYIVERFQKKSNDATAASDMFRMQMSEMINEKILEAPFLGSGLGAHIDLRDGAIEMTYQDIVIRLGIVGLVTFLFPVFQILHQLKRRHDYMPLGDTLVSGLIAVMFASYFNPYLVTSLGIFTYCLCIHVYTMHGTWNENRKTCVGVNRQLVNGVLKGEV